MLGLLYIILKFNYYLGTWKYLDQQQSIVWNFSGNFGRANNRVKIVHQTAKYKLINDWLK